MASYQSHLSETDFCKHCGDEFVKTKHNQVYCNDEHRRLATNKRIMERYYANKAKKLERDRKCVCGTLLSQYNEEDRCYQCSAGASIDNMQVLENLIS